MRIVSNMSVSVIIPAFQAVNTICATLSSVMKISSAVEIIVIDDGSTDGTGDLVRARFKDGRVRVVSQSNGGRSAARNRGITEATGDWIMFVDADDQILSDEVSCFFNDERNASLYNLVCFPFTSKMDENASSVTERKAISANSVAGVMVREEGRSSLHASYELNSCWSKLYRRNKLVAQNGNLKVAFPRGVRFSEDRLFNLKYLKCLGDDKILFMDGKPLYQWNVDGSNTVGTVRISDIDSIFQYVNAVANLVKENVISADEADSLISREALNQFSRSVETDTFDHDSVKEHWEKVLSNGRIFASLGDEVPTDVYGAFGYRRLVIWLLKHGKVDEAMKFCRFLWNVKVFIKEMDKK